VNLEYKINEAIVQNIYDHLINCDKYFIPYLSNKVDINEYSIKIKKNGITFEAWYQNKLIGLIAVYFNDKEYLTAFITNVSIEIKYAGKGIASKLMELCIDYAVKNNYKSILLEVAKNNDKAIKLYEKYDFKNLGVKQDLIIMKKNI